MVFIEGRPTQQEIEKHQVTPEQWAKALQYYQAHKMDLVQAAAFSARQAVSHRQPPFRVGCAVMTIEPSLPDGEYAIYQAYNFTPAPTKPKGRDKRCAERNALDNVFGTVVALTTVSKEISTGDATKAHDTLHPCEDCRGLLRELLQKGNLREDTIVCNANHANDPVVMEERTVKQLLDLYADDAKIETPHS